ncbi:MAG: SAM-dependent methyltransferase, partial [Caulobacteraceae bacterium]
MPLKDRLAAQIAVSGPMTVAQYMTACLHDPKDGYYATRPAIGETGDFITAPQVSQMFGELIGLWAAEVWAALGRPERVILAEVGPGDGALMLDALRAVRAAPAFVEAAEVWLVEVSKPLQAVQAERLAHANLSWTASLSGLPTDAPLILIANEVLDCLPARQFVRTEEGWAERLVGVGEVGDLRWGLAAADPHPPLRGDFPQGGKKGAEDFAPPLGELA